MSWKGEFGDREAVMGKGDLVIFMVNDLPNAFYTCLMES